MVCCGARSTDLVCHVEESVFIKIVDLTEQDVPGPVAARYMQKNSHLLLLD